MPRVAITVTPITRDGVTGAAEADGDPANNHSIANTGRVFVEVRNASVDTAHDVTFVTQTTIDGQAVGDRTTSIPFGETHRFGSFPVNFYGRELHVDVAHADLKLRAFSY